MRRLLLPLAFLLLAGCESKPGPSSSAGTPAVAKNHGGLVAARLDTLPILQSDPDYQKLADQYTRENIELRKRMDKLVENGQPKEEVGQEYLKQQQLLNNKWMKATNDFIQTRHGKLREVVQQLASEKGIDLVVIDSKAYPTVEFGAFDITQDVLLKIYGSPVQGTPTPGGTPQ